MLMSIQGVVIGQKKVSETTMVKERIARKYYLQVDIVHMNNSPEVDLNQVMVWLEHKVPQQQEEIGKN